MRAITIAAVLLPLAACGASPLDDPDRWSCDALIEPVIEMSEDRAFSVLEITNPTETQRTYGPKPTIKCRASAEWSYGEGYIVYEAYVSNGGQIILGYERK